MLLPGCISLRLIGWGVLSSRLLLRRAEDDDDVAAESADPALRGLNDRSWFAPAAHGATQWGLDPDIFRRMRRPSSQFLRGGRS